MESNAIASSYTKQSGSVSIAGIVELYYELRSPPSSVSPESLENVVMIIGVAATSRHFEEAAIFYVNHFSNKKNQVRVLTFDNRGVGRSTWDQHEKLSIDLMAKDTLELINQVLGTSSRVHLYGASMGGMIAQKLSLNLLTENRLKSIYLGVTCMEPPMKPLSFLGSSAWSFVIRLLLSLGHVRFVNHFIIPDAFNEEDMESDNLTDEELNNLRRRFTKLWTDEFDQWFAFRRRHVCASQFAAVFGHQMLPEDVLQMKISGIPITVQIATKDKQIPPAKQHALAEALGAEKIILKQGHAARNNLILTSYVAHLQRCFTE